MRDKINEYHLHKDDHSKLHLEIRDAKPYLATYSEHVYKAHRHTFYQFIWFENAGSHFVDYEEITHPADSLFILNKNQVHYFCQKSDNSGLLYHFDEIFMNRGDDEFRQRIEFQLFNEVGSPFLILDTSTKKILKSMTDLLQKEIAVQKYNYRALIFSLMQTLVLAIDRLKTMQRGGEKEKNTHQEIAKNFKRYIEENMDQFLSLADYAGALHISIKKLTNISHEYFLMSPAKYIAYRKILEAKRLLSNVKISIKEVAYQLGFDQPTYFTKYFKKHTGLTPKEFIKSLP